MPGCKINLNKLKIKNGQRRLDRYRQDHKQADGQNVQISQAALNINPRPVSQVPGDLPLPTNVALTLGSHQDLR